nr:uncharacterized protein LOC124806533 isoform X2 [Hydra vulgaris]
MTFSTQDFQDGQIATMEDGKETVSILNIEALDDTSDVQSIVTIPDEEPTQSTSGCNKQRNSDDEKTLNKIAKTEPLFRETSVKEKAIGKTWKAFWPYFDQEVEH